MNHLNMLTTMLTRMKILIAVVYLLLALPLWAQTPTDNPVLIDITTLDQLYAIRYDLDGDGVASTGNEAAYLDRLWIGSRCEQQLCRAAARATSL